VQLTVNEKIRIKNLSRANFENCFSTLKRAQIFSGARYHKSVFVLWPC